MKGHDTELSVGSGNALQNIADENKRTYKISKTEISVDRSYGIWVKGDKYLIGTNEYVGKVENKTELVEGVENLGSGGVSVSQNTGII